MLNLFGLDDTAMAVYRLLLANPSWSFDTLAAASGLTPEKLRHSLNSLVESALIRHSPDDDGRFRPVHPEVGFTALLAREEALISARNAEIARGRRQLSELLTELSHQQERTFTDEEVHGGEAVRDRLQLIAANTREQALCFANGGPQPEYTLAASAELDQAALARGVEMRTIYLDTVRHHPPTRSYARWLMSLGGQCRTTASLPMRMLVVDRELALLPLKIDDREAGAQVIRTPSTVAALIALFEAYWQVSTSFEQAGPQRQNESYSLATHERELLRLLAQGLKDEAIARSMGMSVRSVRRIVADVMLRTKATSRFQAAVIAVRNGWV